MTDDPEQRYVVVTADKCSCDASRDEQSRAQNDCELECYEQLTAQAGENDDDADDGRPNLRSMGLPRRRGWIRFEIPIRTLRRRLGRSLRGAPVREGPSPPLDGR